MVFSQEGILAFSNCCWNCTDSYADCSASSFTSREQGISFFKFFLSGGNYTGDWGVQAAYVAYTDLDYLYKNWEGECDLIRRWCAVLEVKEYTIEKPESDETCIVVTFKQPVTLEVEDYGTDDDCLDFDDDQVEDFDCGAEDTP